MAWAPDYATVDEFKSYARISDTVDDAEIGLAISAASRAVDNHTGRQFGRVTPASARRYGTWRHNVTLDVYARIDDLQDTTGLVVEDENAGVVAPADYELLPINAASYGDPYTQLWLRRDTAYVTVTAFWGWTDVPTSVKQATLLQASRILKRREAPFGVAGSPELGSEVRLLAKIDPDVEVILRPYRRWHVS